MNPPATEAIRFFVVLLTASLLAVMLFWLHSLRLLRARLRGQPGERIVRINCRMLALFALQQVVILAMVTTNWWLGDGAATWIDPVFDLAAQTVMAVAIAGALSAVRTLSLQPATPPDDALSMYDEGGEAEAATTRKRRTGKGA